MLILASEVVWHLVGACLCVWLCQHPGASLRFQSGFVSLFLWLCLNRVPFEVLSTPTVSLCLQLSLCVSCVSQCVRVPVCCSLMGPGNSVSMALEKSGGFALGTPRV